MKYKVLIIIYLLFIISCNKTKILQLKELDTIEIICPRNVYKMSLQIKGNLNCLTTIIVKSGSLTYNLGYELNGHVDTLLTNDWYNKIVSFDLINKECINEDVIINVKLSSF